MKLIDGRLSEAHLEFSKREGYFIAENVFEKEELDPNRWEEQIVSV